VAEQTIAKAMSEVQKNQSQDGLAEQRHRFVGSNGCIAHAGSDGLGHCFEHLSSGTGKIKLRTEFDVSQCRALENGGQRFLHECYVKFERDMPMLAITRI